MGKKTSDRQHIQSVVVGSRLLEALVRRNNAMSLTALSKAAGMVPAKAHRYLASYVTTGLIAQSESTGLYDLGPLALDLGLASIRRLDVSELAYPHMIKLRDETDETISLSVWGNFGPTLVRWVPSNAPVSISVNVGSVLPLITSSNGRIFAAYAASEKVEAMIQSELCENATALKASRLDSREAVDELLETVREKGIAESVGLVVPAISSLSCPVFDRENSIIAALTVVGITKMISTEKDSPVAAKLRDTAALVSKRLGAKLTDD